MKKRKIMIGVPIIGASGMRYYEVEAKDSDEAKRLVKEGKVACCEEEIDAEVEEDMDAWEMIRDGDD